MRPGELLVYDSVRCHARQRGVSCYMGQVAAGLERAFGERMTLMSSELSSAGPARRVRLVPGSFRGSGRLRVHRINEWAASLWAYRHAPKVYFSPYYGRVRTKAAAVFMVHDMIHECYGGWLCDARQRQALVAEKAACCRRSALLLTASHSTREQVLSSYRWVDSRHVRVIPLGVDIEMWGAAPATETVDRCRRPFFLYVGDRWPYKNFLGAVKAFGQSGLARDMDLVVVSANHRALAADEFAACQALGLVDRVCLIGAVTDAQLRDLYRRAVASVYPSHVEGFGLPVLEALASGTVVIAADIAALREVGAAVPLYADPRSSEALAAQMRRAGLMAARDRSERVAAGRLRAAALPWDRCVEATAAAIAELL